MVGIFAQCYCILVYRALGGREVSIMHGAILCNLQRFMC